MFLCFAMADSSDRTGGSSAVADSPAQVGEGAASPTERAEAIHQIMIRGEGTASHLLEWILLTSGRSDLASIMGDLPAQLAMGAASSTVAHSPAQVDVGAASSAVADSPAQVDEGAASSAVAAYTNYDMDFFKNVWPLTGGL